MPNVAQNDPTTPSSDAPASRPLPLGDDEPIVVINDYGTFAQIPTPILLADISNDAKVLYAHLWSFSNGGANIFPSRRTLMKRMGCSLASLKRYMAELVTLGAVIREARRRESDGAQTSNSYRLPVMRVEGGSPVSPGGPTSEPPRTRSIEPKREKRASAKPIPEDWTPGLAHRHRHEGRGVDVDLEAEKFRAHALANDRRLVNWDQGFANWLLNAKPSGVSRETPAPRTNGQKAIDLAKQIAEEEAILRLNPEDGRPW